MGTQRPVGCRTWSGTPSSGRTSPPIRLYWIQRNQCSTGRNRRAGCTAALWDRVHGGLHTRARFLHALVLSHSHFRSVLRLFTSCDGIFQVKMDNVNSVSPPTTATSMYFSATNSSVLQVSTVSGTIYNHVHLQSYPFGRVEWAMCSRLSQTNFPGFPQVSVLPLPRFAGASEAAMAPTPNGWELQGVNYYTGSQLKEMQAGIMTHYGGNWAASRAPPGPDTLTRAARLARSPAAHTLNTNLNGSASSLNWGITVHQQNAPKVILTLQSQVMGRTACGF